jgi:hypothetical protein
MRRREVRDDIFLKDVISGKSKIISDLEIETEA